MTGSFWSLGRIRSDQPFTDQPGMHFGWRRGCHHPHPHPDDDGGEDGDDDVDDDEYDPDDDGNDDDDADDLYDRSCVWLGGSQ